MATTVPVSAHVLWAVVSGCVGFLLGQHVMLFSPEDGHRRLDQKLPSTSESLELLQGRRAITILKRCLISTYFNLIQTNEAPESSAHELSHI